MKVLITGDRKWRSEYQSVVNELFEEFEIYKGKIEVVVGDCPTGIDNQVRECCIKTGIPFKCFVANWAGEGNRAGPLRNKAMVEQRPDLCVAIHTDYPDSKGTKNCASQAIQAGITTVLMPRSIPFLLKDYEL